MATSVAIAGKVAAASLSSTQLHNRPRPAGRQSAFFGHRVARQAPELPVSRASRHVTPQAQAVATRSIEKETMVPSPPETLLREGEQMKYGADEKSANMRARFEKLIREIQDEVCSAIEELDGTKFRTEAWTRPGGGGGITRVLGDGNVFEKAGVNVSVVYGTMPPEVYRAASGKADGEENSRIGKARIPFFATGISSVIHPRNPKAPTAHFNYRYFETESPDGDVGAPRTWWFGGGTDLTPAYVFDEDVTHFHQLQKDACDKVDPALFPKFKKWCDEYFLIKHRGETRGLGGIFYDDQNEKDPEEYFKLASYCGHTVVPAYIPLVAKHKDDPFTAEEKKWQQIRRGRYAEFNLVYDRGTIFGLRTGGRIESILMSLPLTARWEYDHHPAAGTEEAKLLDLCRNPRDWV